MKDYLLTVLPIAIIMASAVISYIIGRHNEKARDLFSSAFALLAAVFYGIVLFTGIDAKVEFSRLLYSVSIGGLHSLYAFITSIMWFVTTAFSTPYFKAYDERNRYYLFSLLTFGATIGVFLSSNLFTLFTFFEIMSFTSYVMVVHDRKPETLKAASTYLAVSVTGGMVMLMGLFIFKVPDLELGIPVNTFAASLLMLFGFGAKAGAFPVHVWLPKAHPAAPAPASALLSGVLTKAGVYGVLMITAEKYSYDGISTEKWGYILLAIGVITMLLGGVLALLSVNLKRTLACSSMSQIGFIFVGISMQALLGHERTLAAGGTILHMVNHSLIKLVLFVCAGIIYMNLHKLNLNEIRGWGRGKPLITAIFLLGALDICGIPPFGGYISKTLLHESIVEYAATLSGTSYIVIKICEYLFLFTGGLTVAYMTKLFVCIFVRKPSAELAEHKAVRLPWYTSIPLTAIALVLPVLGIFSDISRKITEVAAPFLKSEPLPELPFFSVTNLTGSAISISIGAVLYLVVVRKLLTKDNCYKDLTNSRFDIDERLYKPLMYKLLPGFFGGISVFISELPVYVAKAVARLSSVLAHALADLPDGILILLRKTLYREVPVRKPDVRHAIMSSKIGLGLEKTAAVLGVEEEKRKNLDLRFAATVEAVRLTLRKITRNLSFAMIVACIGLCIALIFLLFIN